MTTMLLPVTDPNAKGRNGQDALWEAVCVAMWAGLWGLTLEGLRTLNTFHTAHAVDCMVTLSDLRAAQASKPGLTLPQGRMAELIEAEVLKWNRAVEGRWRLS